MQKLIGKQSLVQLLKDYLSNRAAFQRILQIITAIDKKPEKERETKNFEEKR